MFFSGEESIFLLCVSSRDCLHSLTCDAWSLHLFSLFSSLHHLFASCLLMHSYGCIGTQRIQDDILISVFLIEPHLVNLFCSEDSIHRFGGLEHRHLWVIVQLISWVLYSLLCLLCLPPYFLCICHVPLFIYIVYEKKYQIIQLTTRLLKWYCKHKEYIIAFVSWKFLFRI